MSETPSPTDPTSPVPRRGRRGRRIALICVTAVLALVGGTLVSGYVMANQLAGDVQRIPGVFTEVSTTGLAAVKGSETILVTGNDALPVSHGLRPSGLIAIVHLNAGRTSGSVVSIPPQTLVPVPGHGRIQLEKALVFGGPALLVRTVQNLTGVRLDHYGVVDFARVANVVNALGGVNVYLTQAQASYYGVRFHAGYNHLNGRAALAYVRQGSITESQRVARQQNLLRSILQKIGGQSLLSNPLHSYTIVRAFTQALSVDSNFSNGDLMSLATSAKSLKAGSGTFVTAPIRTSGVLVQPESSQLWHAIATDSVAAFAQEYPATVTSVAPQ